MGTATLAYVLKPSSTRWDSFVRLNLYSVAAEPEFIPAQKPLPMVLKHCCKWHELWNGAAQTDATNSMPQIGCPRRTERQPIWGIFYGFRSLLKVCVRESDSLTPNGRQYQKETTGPSHWPETRKDNWNSNAPAAPSRMVGIAAHSLDYRKKCLVSWERIRTRLELVPQVLTPVLAAPTASGTLGG